MVSTAFSVQAGGRGASEGIVAAIRRASARTGVEFDYLFNQARLESGFRPSVTARTSSATGLFQFIDQTWLATVKLHGAEHGLAWAAAAIGRDANGRYRVDDPGARREILDLRKDPEAASAMAAELASDNRVILEQRLGRKAEPVDLYLAHFLGAAGATKLLVANDANPEASAADLLPRAAQANRSVFFDNDGSPRGVGEIRERFAARFDGAAPAGVPAVPTTGEFVPLRLATLQAGTAPPPLARPSPQYARLAYLMLAEIGS